MKNPYNTGRILIGSNYHPDTRPPIWGDMLTLQSALLDGACKVKQTPLQRLINKVWRWL